MLDLVKGQKIELSKESDPKSILRIGAGWDANTGTGDKFDVDLSVFAYDDKKNLIDVIYFNKLKALGIEHSGDNLTGAGDGEDEFFKLDESKLDPKVHSVVAVANIYRAASKGQNFGQIKNCFIKVTNETTSTEVCKLDLSEDFSSYSGVILGRVYRHNGSLKFEAVSKGVNGTLDEIQPQVAATL